TGRVYVERVHEIPDMGRAAKGRSIANILELKPGETIAALIRIRSQSGQSGEDSTWQQPGFVFFSTRLGTVKKTALAEFGSIGKRTSFEEYRRQSRGGKGIITMKTTEKTGAVVGALTVKEQDEIMLITVAGQMVRIFVKDIREAGRNTQGVKLINLEANDKLQAIAPVISEDKADEEESPAPPA